MKKFVFILVMLSLYISPLPLPAAEAVTIQSDKQNGDDAYTGVVYLTEENVNTLIMGATGVILVSEKQSIPFRWRYLISDKVLVSVSIDTVKDTSGFNVLPGGDSANREIHFTALAPGECVITFRYGSYGETDWDGDYDVENIYHVVITEK